MAATSYMAKLRALREYYAEFSGDIIAYHSSGGRGWYDSYPVNWNKLFTPIEKNAWYSIRAKGHITLYPQYPVNNYYLDFGNPWLKIGLELDGKAYHNKERDILRDVELKTEGWTIYRVTGSEMMNQFYKDLSDFSNDELDERWNEDFNSVWQQLKYWITNTGDGVIEAIKRVHFLDSADEWNEFRQLCVESLEAHRLV